MNAKQTKQHQLIFENLPIFIFSYIKFPVKKTNVGKIFRIMGKLLFCF